MFGSQFRHKFDNSSARYGHAVSQLTWQQVSRCVHEYIGADENQNEWRYPRAVSLYPLAQQRVLHGICCDKYKNHPIAAKVKMIR
jgi:hypothetical protein